MQDSSAGRIAVYSRNSGSVTSSSPMKNFVAGVTWTLTLSQVLQFASSNVSCRVTGIGTSRVLVSNDASMYLAARALRAGIANSPAVRHLIRRFRGDTFHERLHAMAGYEAVAPSEPVAWEQLFAAPP